MMQLGTPAFVGVILRQQGLAQLRAHRCLLAGVLAPLAAQHADRIMLFVAGTVEPSLNVETLKRTGAPVLGWRHSRAASCCRAARSPPFAGGAASS